MRVVEYPCYLGSKRILKEKEWNEKYGIDNWEIGWLDSFQNKMTFPEIFEHYILGYESYFRKNIASLYFLASKYSFVYDIDSDITKTQAFDRDHFYNKHGKPNQFHHVAINRAIEERIGIKFSGNIPGQVRGLKFNIPLTDWPTEAMLQPGFIKCISPQLIRKPNVTTWWINVDSIEGLYQYNKVLFIRD